MAASKSNDSSKFPLYFLLILLAIGLLWLKSSYGKLAGGTFVNGLGKTLTAFASKNPHAWYKDYLNNSAIPNSTMLGNAIMYGELLSAIAIAGGAIFLLVKSTNKIAKIVLGFGLVGAFVMNLNFYFAAGHTSPSTESLNLLMLVIEAIAAFTVFKSAANS